MCMPASCGAKAGAAHDPTIGALRCMWLLASFLLHRCQVVRNWLVDHSCVGAHQCASPNNAEDRGHISRRACCVRQSTSGVEPVVRTSNWPFVKWRPRSQSAAVLVVMSLLSELVLQLLGVSLLVSDVLSVALWSERVSNRFASDQMHCPLRCKGDTASG